MPYRFQQFIRDLRFVGKRDKSNSSTSLLLKAGTGSIKKTASRGPKLQHTPLSELDEYKGNHRTNNSALLWR